MIGKIIVALALSAVAASACPYTSYGFDGSYGLGSCGLSLGCGVGYPDAAAALAYSAAAVPSYLPSIALPGCGVSSCLGSSIAAPFYPASPIAYPATSCGLIY